MQGGEFLVGNGFIFKDTIDDIQIFLRKVAEKDVVAVGIKFDRFSSFIDMEQIAKIADKLKLPIFRIPFRYRWLDIIVKVINERDRLSGAEKSLKMSGRSFLHDLHNMSDLLQELSSRISRPIFFTSKADENGTIFWPDSKITFRSGENAEHYKLANIEKTNVLSGNSDFLGIREEKRTLGIPIYSRVYFTDSPLPFELHVIFEQSEQKLSSSEEEIVNRGTTALKVLLSEQIGLHSLQHREIAQTLERLILGSYSNPKMLLNTLQKWDLLQPVPCRIAITPRRDADSEEIGNGDLPYRFTCLIGNFHVLLIPWSLENNSEKNEAALRYLEKYEAPIALGGIAETLEDVRSSYKDAQRLIDYMKKVRAGNKVLLYDDVAAQVLLASLSEFDDAARIWNKYWQPLKDSKQTSMVKLDEFVSSLIQCNFNLADCSEYLNIHYNTARKYANIVESTLGVSLQVFQVQVCLLIGKSVDHEMS